MFFYRFPFLYFVFALLFDTSTISFYQHMTSTTSTTSFFFVLIWWSSTIFTTSTISFFFVFLVIAIPVHMVWKYHAEMHNLMYFAIYHAFYSLAVLALIVFIIAIIIVARERRQAARLAPPPPPIAPVPSAPASAPVSDSFLQEPVIPNVRWV